MKTYLDCIPCFMHQALRAGRIASGDDSVVKKLLDETGALIGEMPLHNTPPRIGEIVYGKLRELTGVKDPYYHLKKSNIKEALTLYPKLKKVVARSDDSLLMAIRIAIAGNVMDFATGKIFNINGDLEKILEQEFAIFDYDQFRTALDKAKLILYLGDNAGESVFDRILIEELGKEVVFVVREGPVINDVTFEDAIDSGLDKVTRIITSGSLAPGIIPSLCNDDFLWYYKKADLIISKGQGNYEGLSEEQNMPIFFLLKAKCKVIAADLKVQENDIVLKSNLNKKH